MGCVEPIRGPSHTQYYCRVMLSAYTLTGGVFRCAISGGSQGIRLNRCFTKPHSLAHTWVQRSIVKGEGLFQRRSGFFPSLGPLVIPNVCDQPLPDVPVALVTGGL